MMYDAVATQVFTGAPRAPQAAPLATAVAFRAISSTLTALSEAEHLLLEEWLDRAIEALEQTRPHSEEA